ncbi:putative syntaxin 6 [Helianthus annuus]|uniref:Syntaxin 6 n=2 Tax=Helianthus annuus TaxID=4232 RepID=A0A9K3JMN5_HELAN|nr:putative syntaxin 6 [Helianthus annuus]KAJ0613953.1 putative syntaxin 6 [Helianthus annuus]KAJ0938657.1 putative syntaxin 6 [Helianthus annuus]
MANHMSFGGPPVKTETAEEADELMRVDEKASEVEVEVLLAPPKLVYSKLILRFTTKLLVAVADKWDSHVLVMDKVAPQNWKLLIYRMESAYRTWVRQKKEGVKSVDLDELCRELQTALGTAKWQLDEFQSAVRLSYKNSVNDVRTTRHNNSFPQYHPRFPQSN